MTINVRVRACWCSRLHLSLMVLPVLLLGWTAHAEPPPTRPANVSADEEALISRGIELREKGDDEAALRSFRKAYDLSKGARALAQVAVAEQALGRWVEAEADLRQALLRTDDPWIARNKAVLEQALTDIQGSLGSLELAGGVAGAEVRLNGVVAGSFPLKAPLRVTAGSVALEVRAPGYLPVLRTVIVPNRGLARESVVLVPTAVAIPTGPTPMANDVVRTTISAEGNAGAPSSAPWGPRKKAAVALGAAAIVGLGVGTTFLFIRDSRTVDFNHAGCTLADAQQSPSCQSQKDGADAALTVGVVGFVGAAVLGGAATYLYLTDHSGDQGSVAVAHRALAFRCLPRVGAGLACAGEF